MLSLRRSRKLRLTSTKTTVAERYFVVRLVHRLVHDIGFQQTQSSSTSPTKQDTGGSGRSTARCGHGHGITAPRSTHRHSSSIQDAHICTNTAPSRQPCTSNCASSWCRRCCCSCCRTLPRLLLPLCVSLWTGCCCHSHAALRQTALPIHWVLVQRRRRLAKDHVTR
jgi:hypothetical protein